MLVQTRGGGNVLCVKPDDSYRHDALQEADEEAEEPGRGRDPIAASHFVLETHLCACGGADSSDLRLAGWLLGMYAQFEPLIENLLVCYVVKRCPAKLVTCGSLMMVRLRRRVSEMEMQMQMRKVRYTQVGCGKGSKTEASMERFYGPGVMKEGA